jgi:hypothetical protein
MFLEGQDPEYLMDKYNEGFMKILAVYGILMMMCARGVTRQC